MSLDIHITPRDFGRAAVTVMNLSKSFGKAQVLENIGFSVDEDEIVVLLGASGSGKTTILRIIAGLEMPRFRARRAPRPGCDRPSCTTSRNGCDLPVIRAVSEDDD